MKIIFLFLLLSIKPKITNGLLSKLQRMQSNEKIPVIVHLSEKPNYEKIKSLPPSKYVEYLKNFAFSSQQKILDYIENNFRGKVSDLKTYWIFNGFYMKATPDVIYILAERKEVEYITEDFVIKLEEIAPRDEIFKFQKDKVKTVEWNIQKIKADSCWFEGIDGSGVIIGHMDTGVDVDHPALAGKWLSPYWYDAVNGNSYPYDDFGHGTHTMGTILGGDGLGPFQDDIGVAPGAKFVTVKVFDNQGSGYASWIHAGFQQIADWKASGVDIKVCSNSWGTSDLTSLEFWQDCINWRNLGIIPVFANGNFGPSSNTAIPPGNYPVVIGVGATDENDNVASFSSRGPAPDQSPWSDTTYWPRYDWNLIKPNVSAPGVYVRSAIPGGGYDYMSGTSMATPHVAGVIALMYQKNPNLDFELVYSILVDNTYKPQGGEPYPNNNYGWGIVDAYRTLLNTPSPYLPYLTVLNIESVDEDSNGIWEPGENLYIKVSLKNIGGATAKNVNLCIFSSSPYVSIIDSFSLIDSIPSDSTGDNSSDPFVIYALNDAPFGVRVSFHLSITVDTLFSGEKEFSKYIGVPGEDWVVHNCGNIVLTLTRYGTIGFMNSAHIGGLGCRYPRNGTNQLFYGSFTVGVQPGYVIDRYYEENFQDDEDWRTLTNPDGKIRLLEPYDISDEYSFAYYDDSYGETPKGLLCIQKAYSFSDSNYDDFVIMEYTLKNKGNSDINGLYAGMFLDWDINGEAQSNTGNTEQARNMTYTTDSTIYMGCAILNPKRNSNLIGNISMIDNSNFVSPYYGLPDSIQLKFLTGLYSFNNANYLSDWSSVVSAGPFSIPVNDSVKVAFAIAGGESLFLLERTIDSAYAKYWRITSVEEEMKISKSYVNLLPDFFHKKVLISWSLPRDSKGTFALYNVAGARRFYKILNFRKGVNNISIKLNVLNPGIYILRLKAGSIEKKAKMLILR